MYPNHIPRNRQYKRVRPRCIQYTIWKHSMPSDRRMCERRWWHRSDHNEKRRIMPIIVACTQQHARIHTVHKLKRRDVQLAGQLADDGWLADHKRRSVVIMTYMLRHVYSDNGIFPETLSYITVSLAESMQSNYGHLPKPLVVATASTVCVLRGFGRQKPLCPLCALMSLWCSLQFFLFLYLAHSVSLRRRRRHAMCSCYWITRYWNGI